jgi:hypothetical protein
LPKRWRHLQASQLRLRIFQCLEDPNRWRARRSELRLISCDLNVRDATLHCVSTISVTGTEFSSAAFAMRSLQVERERHIMSFGIYIIGYLMLIAGLTTGAHRLNVPPQWIGVVGSWCLIGVAIVRGATGQKDPAS